MIALAAIGAIGVAIGSIHPAGLVLGAVLFAAIGATTIGIGMIASLYARSTSKAVGLTFGLLLVLTLLLPVEIIWSGHDNALAVASCPPYLFALGLASIADVWQLMRSGIIREAISGDWTVAKQGPPGINPETVRAVIIGTLAYLCAGPILIAWAYRRFDRVLDRPSVRPTKERKAFISASVGREAVAPANRPGGRD